MKSVSDYYIEPAIVLIERTFEHCQVNKSLQHQSFYFSKIFTFLAINKSINIHTDSKYDLETVEQTMIVANAYVRNHIYKNFL